MGLVPAYHTHLTIIEQLSQQPRCCSKEENLVGPKYLP
jgi:hypothetical protein